MGTTGDGNRTLKAPSGAATNRRNESDHGGAGDAGDDNDDDEGFYILTVPDDKWVSPDLPLEAGHRNCVTSPGGAVSTRLGTLAKQATVGSIGGGRGAGGGAAVTPAARGRRGPEEGSAR